MPNINIRPAIATDISELASIDHNYSSGYVWKMIIKSNKSLKSVAVEFQEVPLPRTVRVEYPRSPNQLTRDWTQRSGLLVAEYQSKAVGYISLDLNIYEQITLVMDFAVTPKLRRQGIGSALVLSALDWCADHSSRLLTFIFQPKNHPAIELAKKLGFGFSGFQDNYFKNLDTGLFFTRSAI